MLVNRSAGILPLLSDICRTVSTRITRATVRLSLEGANDNMPTAAGRMPLLRLSDKAVGGDCKQQNATPLERARR